MPKIKFTKEDLLSRKQLSAGWRTVTVQEVTEEAGKKDPSSVNIVVTVKVTGGVDDGVVIKNWFAAGTPMGRSSLSKFIECFIKDRNVDLNKEYEVNDTIGLQIDAYCQYDLQRNWNTVIDWRPAPGKAAAQGNNK